MRNVTRALLSVCKESSYIYMRLWFVSSFFLSLLGGIAPHRVLPITLDVGTNNPELLKDPSYVGIQKNRLVGEEYFDFVDEFMQVQFFF